AARDSMERLDRVAGEEVRAFSVMNGEYASWNDTYNFVLGNYDAFVAESLSTDYWKTLGVDLIMIFDSNGQRVWSSFTRPEFGDAAHFDEMLDQPIEAGHPLLDHGALDDSVAGVLRTSAGPMMVASDAILTTYGEGPSAGSFVIARYIDDSLVGDVANRSSANARFIPVTGAGAGPLSRAEVDTLMQSPDRRTVERTHDEVIGYRVVPDITGRPAGVLEFRSPLTITAIGRAVINSAMLIVAGIIAAFLVMLVLLMRRLVIAPVKELTARMQHIRETGDLETNAVPTQSDEVGALAREFDELTTDLHLAQKELEATRDVAVEASRAKSDFLARMSHEIRTPMNGVIGMTELLRNTQLDFEQRRFTETIHSSAECLLEIINDILDFSKIEAGKLQLDMRDVVLGELVEETVDTLASQAHAKGLELINDIAPGLYAPFKGDALRLRQILTNLIGNAIKFTNKGEVIMRAAIVGEDDGTVTVRLQVVDTGIGIRAAKQKDIFDSFAQEDDSTTRLYGGTGLGLAICRQLVELMGGRLEVDSKPGAGSTFSFTLVMDRGTAERAGRAGSGARVAGARILVVDDNATNRDILEAQLKGWRTHCSGAGCAEEALAKLSSSLSRGRPFDLVILDMHMPRTDGIDLARRIRAESAFDNVKLLMLSSMAMPADERTLGELGIAGQLTKPVRQSRLYDCLAVVLSGASLTPDSLAPFRDRTLAGRVLLAEDNPVNQAVAIGMLTSMGVTVDAVADGAAAVTAAAAHDYDAVLMDCQMPVLDGLAAVAEIRRAERAAGGRRTPVVALTANAMAGDRERCLEAGMDQYLGKPFTSDQLHAVLSLYLQRPAAAAPAQPASGAATARSPLDRSVLAVLHGLRQPGSPSLLEKVIGIYRHSAPGLKERLVAAIERREPAAVQENAHALKSSSANVGATCLADLCRQLEQMARQADLSRAAEIRRQLECEYSRVMEALKCELAAVAA
ncbi:MAG TPA: response regulator, partial [Woeseiaceae bacterium]|nr:response regulator [Woeseiaceae bacterium]